MRTALTHLIVPLFLATAAQASQTWVVDDSGGAGVDFTNLQTAINTVSAGDVLLIRPGNYAAYTLSKELTLIGTGPSKPSVAGASKIKNLPAGQRATVASVAHNSLEVSTNAGSVITQSLSANFISIVNSTDVRFHASGFSNGMFIDASRVELVSCTVNGSDGGDTFTGTEGEDGGPGVYAEAGSFVHLAATSASGGDGGDACHVCAGSEGGDGAPGIFLLGGSTAVIAGQGQIRGGTGGFGLDFDGSDAPGVTVYAGSSVRWSTASIVGASGQPPFSGGGSITQPATPDPTLTMTGTPTPGSTMTLTLHGWPGFNGRLQQGSDVALVDDGPMIEQLNNRLRLHPLGPFSTGATLTFAWVVPANFVPGHFRSFQGLKIDPATSQTVERSNSVPIIVR